MNMFDIAAKLVVVVFVCAFLLLAFTLRCRIGSPTCFRVSSIAIYLTRSITIFVCKGSMWVSPAARRKLFLSTQSRLTNIRQRSGSPYCTTARSLSAPSPCRQKMMWIRHHRWSGRLYVGLVKLPFIRDLGGNCEITPQFELGKYLKQLDPTYHHPDYRVDFLIRISDGIKERQLVLEYDGFEFHFATGVAPGLINSSTWRSYLTEKDLEREKVLESFGVQMIRLNRFNLGKDPVATIDGLLRDRLNDMLHSRQ